MAKRIIQHYSVKRGLLKGWRWKTCRKPVFAIAGLILVTASALSISGISSSAKNVEPLVNPITALASTKTLSITDSINMFQDSIATVRCNLVSEVDRYMRSVYPKTKMSPDYIVELCVERDFDIPLLLSQAHQESVFGKYTGGTNSCFGVINKRYGHVNESILGYVDLMKRRYVRTRTPEQLINSGFRVEGSRTAKYAEDPNYSQAIRKIRSNIIRKTDIQDYQMQIKNLRIRLDSLIKKRPDYENPDRRDDYKKQKDSLDQRVSC